MKVIENARHGERQTDQELACRVDLITLVMLPTKYTTIHAPCKFILTTADFSVQKLHITPCSANRFL